jgi:hypothetical protein
MKKARVLWALVLDGRCARAQFVKNMFWREISKQSNSQYEYQKLTWILRDVTEVFAEAKLQNVLEKMFETRANGLIA